MKDFILEGRYGLKYPCTYHKENDVEYYFLDTSSANYVSLHNDKDKLIGIDPEGLYIIGIGDSFAGSTVYHIEPADMGYNIYIKQIKI